MNACRHCDAPDPDVAAAFGGCTATLGLLHLSSTFTQGSGLQACQGSALLHSPARAAPASLKLEMLIVPANSTMASEPQPRDVLKLTLASASVVWYIILWTVGIIGCVAA